MNTFAIGIDLGGTKIAGGLVDETGIVHCRDRSDTDVEIGAEGVMARVASCIQRLRAKADRPVVGIGLGIAGMVDSRQGIVVKSSNLKWAGVNIIRWLLSKLGSEWAGRVVIDKDTNAAALGEWRYGAGSGCSHLIYVTVGTGVGSGLVLGGSIYRGAQHGAGELGHLVLDPNGPVCGCGKRGCLEALASGPSIARACREAIRNGTPSMLATRDLERISAKDVVECAQQGDELAQSVLVGAARCLGIALAYCVDLLNPEKIVIGGGVATGAGRLVLAPVEDEISGRCLPANAKSVQITSSVLGEDAGVVGAAALVRTLEGVLP